MELYELPHDVYVMCVQATSFPSGVLAAHQQLHSMLPTTVGRHFYGVSRPDATRAIIYRAAVEEQFNGEAAKYGCEQFVIKKGSYISAVVADFMAQPQLIGHTFQAMLQRADIDPNGACIEVYLTETSVRCMVRLQQ